MCALSSQTCTLEKLLLQLKAVISKYRASFVSSLVSGLLTYTFAFTNKLVNHDDVTSLFAKGASLSSGRWVLDYIDSIFPNYSMPWIYGIISVLFIAFSSILIIRVFEIKNELLQILLSGAVMVFPSLIGTFSYMFTASSYAVAFFFAVASVYFFTKEDWRYRLLGILPLVLSLGIYQSYISLTASLLLVFMLKDLLYTDKSFGEVLKEGILFLTGMVSALAIYYLITNMLLHITGTAFNSYASESFVTGKSVLRRVLSAYGGFLDILFDRRFSLITTKASQIAHLVMLLFAALLSFLLWIKLNLIKKIFSLLVAVLLPLSINCMFIISKESSIHTLVLYGFVSVYVYFILLVDRIQIKEGAFVPVNLLLRAAKEVVTWSMVLIVAANIYIGNAVYLRMHLAYENTYGHYSSVMALIKATPGFDADSKIALVGSAKNTLYSHQEFEWPTTGITGTIGIGANSYSKEDFIRRYLGMDLPFASEEEIEEIQTLPEFLDMPIYPYDGSVKKIDDYIVVKFE